MKKILTLIIIFLTSITNICTAAPTSATITNATGAANKIALTITAYADPLCKYKTGSSFIIEPGPMRYANVNNDVMGSLNLQPSPAGYYLKIAGNGKSLKGQFTVYVHSFGTNNGKPASIIVTYVENKGLILECTNCSPHTV